MKILNKYSISTKLKAIILLVSCPIFLCISIFLVFNQYNNLQKDLVFNSTANSKIIGRNCSIALVFDDKKGCYEELIKSEPIQFMIDVTVYDTNFNQFTRFVPKYAIKKKVSYVQPIFKDTIYESGSSLNIVEPIYYDSTKYGYIHFRSSYDYLNEKMTNYIIMMVALLLITILITYILAHNFQKIISKPILKLARLTNEISVTGDYSRQLQIQSRDEIGFLYKEFNNLLKVINQKNIEREHTEHVIRKLNEELEEKVEIRTQELQIEKEKTQELLNISDQLLLNILPEPIAIRLKSGEKIIADHYEEASVVFIDIVDFTKLSAKSTPQKMVNLLNDVFSKFDKISAKYGLEKIKTIGDCYMAAAGIPLPRHDHVCVIAEMAIEAMDTMKNYKTKDGEEIKFRIGLDCGPIVAGVIGEQKFIYDLWGDMVNTASRMETDGVIGKIQCTERFKEKLEKSSSILKIKIEERGEVDIKGKGIMRTYFIHSNSI